MRDVHRAWVGVACAALLLGAGAGSAAEVGSPPKKVVLFTDFSRHGSTEDLLDVSVALQSPDIDLQCVVLEVQTEGDTTAEATLRKICERMALPPPTILVGSTRDQLTATRYKPALKDTVAKLLQWLEGLPEGERITVVCTGRLTNMWEFMRRGGQAVKDRVEHFYVAAGYLRTRNLEYCAELDIEAWVNAMRTGLPIVLVPRDVSGTPILRPVARDQMNDLMEIKGEEATRPIWTSSMPAWMLVVSRNDPRPWEPALRVRPCRFEVAYSGHTLDCDFESTKPNMSIVTKMDDEAALLFLAETLGAPRPSFAGEPDMTDAFLRLASVREAAPTALRMGEKVIVACRAAGRVTITTYDGRTGAWDEPATIDMPARTGGSSNVPGPISRPAATRPTTGRWRGMPGGGPPLASPALFADQAGRLHLVADQDGRLRHWTSGDGRAWSEAAAPAPRGACPQAFTLADGRVHLFCRDGGDTAPWIHLRADADGRVWQPLGTILEMGTRPADQHAGAVAVFTPGADGRTVHVMWSLFDGNAGLVNTGALEQHPWRPVKYSGLAAWAYRYNLYYLRYTVQAGEWRAIDGRKVTLPVARADADSAFKVIDSGDEFICPGWVVIDEADEPCLLFQAGTSDGRIWPIVMRWRAAVFQDQRWWHRSYDDPLDDWPATIVARLRGRGWLAGAADPGAGGADEYLSTRRFWREGLGLFLWNASRGYAPRPLPTSRPGSDGA